MIMAKLTEQDILNWNGPEDDYMNSDQLAFFRELLVKMQDELIQNASVTTGHLQEHESAPDPADRATQEEEYALELRTRDRERKLLAKVQATIRSIDEGDYGFLYPGSGMKLGTFSFNRQVGSDYKSEDRAREIFDDLKPTTKVKVAISFKNNITLKELCDYMKKYDKVGFFYAPVKISEVGYQGYTGITLGRSGYGMTNFYDKEKYPYLDLLQYDGVDIPPEIYEEHFMTLLNYMNDQKKFNKVIRSYFDYESIISYVEQYGIYSYGVVVKGTVEEVKKLMEDENYDDIFVLDTWLTSYTN